MDDPLTGLRRFRVGIQEAFGFLDHEYEAATAVPAHASSHGLNAAPLSVLTDQLLLQPSFTNQTPLSQTSNEASVVRGTYEVPSDLDDEPVSHDESAFGRTYELPPDSDSDVSDDMPSDTEPNAGERPSVPQTSLIEAFRQACKKRDRGSCDGILPMVIQLMQAGALAYSSRRSPTCLESIKSAADHLRDTGVLKLADADNDGEDFTGAQLKRWRRQLIGLHRALVRTSEIPVELRGLQQEAKVTQVQRDAKLRTIREKRRLKQEKSLSEGISRSQPPRAQTTEAPGGLQTQITEEIETLVTVVQLPHQPSGLLESGPNSIPTSCDEITKSTSGVITAEIGQHSPPLMLPFAGSITMVDKISAKKFSMMERNRATHGRVPYWVDGSVSSYGLASAAVVFEDSGQPSTKWVARGYRIPARTSVNVAEAFAIWQALHIALGRAGFTSSAGFAQRSTHVSLVVVYTDSQAALQAILDPWMVGCEILRPVVRNIALLSHALQLIGVQLQLNWIKGHDGVPGNMIADAVASKASDPTYPAAGEWTPSYT